MIQEVEDRLPAVFGLLFPHQKLPIAVSKGPALAFLRATHVIYYCLSLSLWLFLQKCPNEHHGTWNIVLENGVGVYVTRLGCFVVSFDSRGVERLCSRLGLWYPHPSLWQRCDKVSRVSAVLLKVWALSSGSQMTQPQLTVMHTNCCWLFGIKVYSFAFHQWDCKGCYNLLMCLSSIPMMNLKTRLPHTP